MTWANAIINKRFDVISHINELETYARLLNLMIHFELDHIIVLQ